jgi:hypothetical protein
VDVNNKQLSEENRAIVLSNCGFKSEGEDSKDIKTELKLFKGSQKILQIRPLPLRVAAFENESEVEEASTSEINFRAYIYILYTDIKRELKKITIYLSSTQPEPGKKFLMRFV